MDFLNELKNITNEENIFVNEPMKKHTTFKTGGNADFLVTPSSKEEIQKLFALDVPKIVMGNGSNLLVKDGGIRGLVIKLSKNDNYKVCDNVIEADAGICVAKLSQIALKHKLKGLEFACGIPGTLGGAVYMNASAYGGEMANVVFETDFLKDNGEIVKITDYKFSYRKSVFQNMNGIILSSKLKLEIGNQEEIKSKMEEYKESRNTKQPVNFPSAGSTFKRPDGYFAGKLIEDAGLKGYRIGGAEVSTLHAGFVINANNATSKDILNLISYIQDVVNKKFGVELETEVKIIGED